MACSPVVTPTPLIESPLDPQWGSAMSVTTHQLSDQLRGGTGSSYDRARQRVLIAEWRGRISSINERGQLDTVGSGYASLEDIEISARGQWALVSQRDGLLLQVSLADADRSRARVVVAGLQAPHQIVLDRDRVAYVVEFGRSGRLLAVDIRSGRVTQVASGLRGAIGLALSADRSTAYVSEQGVGTGQVTEIVLTTGRRRVVSSGLVNPFMLQWANDDRTALLVAERDPRNRITEINLRRRRPPVLEPRLLIDRADELGPLIGGGPRARFGRRLPTTPILRASTSVFLDHTAHRPSSVQRTDFGFVVIADRIATLVRREQPPSVEFEGGGPMFPATYRRVGVLVSGSGLTFDDLDFVVQPGPELGRVSYSRDDRFDPLNPEIMVLAGPELGAWTIEARRRSDAHVVGTAAMETTDVWAGSEGPPIWFQGASQPNVLGAAWGGGGSGPQNLDITPQSGTRGVAMALVDTADSRYPTDSSAIAQQWEDETINGVPAGTGPDRSVRAFFRGVGGQVDDGSGTMAPRFDIALDGVHGPVSLSGDWDDYFEPISATDDRWEFKAALVQAAVTAADDVVDFTQVDSFVIVVKTVPEDPSTGTAAKMAWPFGWGTMVSSSDGDDRNIKVVIMPHDWDVRDTREIHETLAHELGHNLGLPDLYMDAANYGAVASRDVDSWDTMSFEGALGHFTTPNKLRLGWILGADVKTFDFTSSGAVDEVVELHASSLGAPPSGRFSAVEVRIADGWNYYFEYRSEQETGIGDQQLPQDRRVVGTDVILPDYTAPIVRRQVILLPKDADGDGPVLDVGDDYEEQDASTPTAPADFKVEVLDTDDDWARIRVSYGANSRPDPSIRPWPGSGTNAWQSPDIEVFNDKNTADATFRNLPWTGHSNRIVARVRNSGSLMAIGVRVNFSVKDFALGDSVETPLGFDIKDIPAGDTVEFEFDGWVPPSGGHFCVVARIPLHINSDALNTVELTELNNRGQSNYTEFISAEASPPHRERTMVTVANPYPEPTRVYLSPVQTNPLFRTYLATSQVHLGPGEERQVEMMFEALHGTPDQHLALERNKDEWMELPNSVGVAGFIDDPLDPLADHPLPTGGVSIRVRTGVSTDLKAWDDANVVVGRVTAADGTLITDGQVIVTIREPGDRIDKETRVAIIDDGTFDVEFGDVVDGAGFTATAEYLGAGRWAPSPPFVFTT